MVDVGGECGDGDAARTWVFLSPHLDDAVLSCGGVIHALACRHNVEVWSIFCSAPVCGPYSGIAKWLHSVSGGKTGSRLARARRAEDLAACRILQTGCVQFGWYDAAYRRDRFGRALYSNCRNDSWKSRDETLITAITRQLVRQLDPTDQLVVPLGVGKHIDHVITRAATESISGRTLLYYPELPYLQVFPDDILIAAAGLTAMKVRLDLRNVQCWCEAVDAYSSQRAMLEDAAGPLERMIITYAEHGPQMFVRSKDDTQRVATALDNLI